MQQLESSIQSVQPRARLRLQRIERVLRAGEFKRIFRHGGCYRDPLMRIHYLRKKQGPPRLGLVVGRKLGNAVHRNLAKRRLREAFRAAKRRVPDALDLLLIPEPRRGPAPLEDYRQVIDRFLEWYRSRRTGDGGAGTR